MLYQIAAIPMTLTGHQGYAPVAGPLKCNFSYSCAAVDDISTNVVCHRSMSHHPSAITEPLLLCCSICGILIVVLYVVCAEFTEILAGARC